MSSNLYWRPSNLGKKDLSTDLKFKLRGLYGEPLNIMLNKDDLDILRALEVCKTEGASTLIKAIEKYGELSVWEEY